MSGVQSQPWNRHLAFEPGPYGRYISNIASLPEASGNHYVMDPSNGVLHPVTENKQHVDPRHYPPVNDSRHPSVPPDPRDAVHNANTANWPLGPPQGFSSSQAGTVNVDISFLRALENKIGELQVRVDGVEQGPMQSFASSRSSSFDLNSDSDAESNHEPSKRRHRQPRGRQLEDSIVGAVEIMDDQRIHPSTRSGDPVIVAPDQSSDVVKPSRGNKDGKLEILRWRQSMNPYGDFEKRKPDHDPTFSGAAPNKHQNEPLLTVTRELDRDKQLWRRRIEIASPSFIKLLPEIQKYVIGVNLVDGTNGAKLFLTEPFMILFHNRERLKDHVVNLSESIQAREQTRLILDFMKNECSDVDHKLDNLETEGPSGLISYAELWLLYRPGTIVFSREDGEFEAFVVESVLGMQKHWPDNSKRHSYDQLDLNCWSINYDGEIFGRVWSIHCIAPFYGAREIASLDLVPGKYLPNIDSIRSLLVSRGAKFWSLQGRQFQQYTGGSLVERTANEAVRVVVDHFTYQRHNNWPIVIDKKYGPSNSQRKYWQDNRFSRRERGDNLRRMEYSPDERQDGPYRRYRAPPPPWHVESYNDKYDFLEPKSSPDDLTLMLCPQHVHGYALRDKEWRNLNVSQLQPVAFRKNAWDRLVLDEEYKNIIQAMVSSYVDKYAGKTALLNDLVAGKGTGLVVLLHGPPGSGKTLTAECVAESFERPLYHITCDDIATDPDRLEERLEEIFDYAVTWDAVLLLDEADIFLQDRDFQDRDYVDLERNALVSTFLRTLEYFNGILFLTTTRVGAFDQAFQSHIHVTLGLPPLDQQRRSSVWDIFLQDLKAKRAVSKHQYDTLVKLVEEKWSKENLNGRQIRNVVRTALVLAEKRGEEVSERDFETVLRIGREFEGYVGTLGKGEEERMEKRTGEESVESESAGSEGFQEI